MIRIIPAACALTFVLVLSACGLTSPWNAQTKAGIADAELETALDDQGRVYVKAVRLTDGKERGNVALRIKRQGEYEIEYTASDVRAFDGQKVRGEIEKEIPAALKDAAPGIVDSIMGVVSKYLGSVP